MKPITSATLTVLALGTAVGAAGAGEPVSEHTANLKQIHVTDYVESLGWNYSRGRWSGTAPAASELGGGAAVAILDGRTYLSHSDLPYIANGNVDPYTDSAAFVFSGNSYTTYSTHATHVSGLIGARLNGRGSAGVAPEARLLSFAVFDDNGWIGVNETEVLRSAVKYGASVANMSYGPSSKGDLISSSTVNAIDTFRDQIVVVKSAGNDGTSLRNENVTPQSSGTPLTNLIIVGSVLENNQIAQYSNTPGDGCFKVNRRCAINMRDIFIVAPGGDAQGTDSNGYIGGVWSTGPRSSTDYYRLAGTSMATPQVAGAVALLHGRWPALKDDPQKTRDILFDTAQDLGAKGTDAVYGRGLLDVKAAMAPVGDPAIEVGGGGTGGGTGGSGTGGSGTGGSGGSSGGGSSTGGWSGWGGWSSWFSSVTQMRASRALAALGQTDTTLSVFDKYDRDFPIALRGLVRSSHQALTDNLLGLIGGRDVEDRSDFGSRAGAPRYGLRTGAAEEALSNPPDFLVDIDLMDDKAAVFVGHGDAVAAFHRPVVRLGLLDSQGPDLTGTNPVLALASGDFQSGLRLGGPDNWQVSFGFARSGDNSSTLPVVTPSFDRRRDYRADALVAALSHSVGETARLNLTLTQLTESRGLLGAYGEGALSFSDGNETLAATSSLDWTAPFGIDVSASYTFSRTRGDGGDGILHLTDGFFSDAFAVAFAKSDLFRTGDRAGLALSQPLRPLSGEVVLTANRHWLEGGGLEVQVTPISLVPEARELDLIAEYEMGLGRTGRLSTYAFFTLNEGHKEGETAAGLGTVYRRPF